MDFRRRTKFISVCVVNLKADISGWGCQLTKRLHPDQKCYFVIKFYIGHDKKLMIRVGSEEILVES